MFLMHHALLNSSHEPRPLRFGRYAPHAGRARRAASTRAREARRPRGGASSSGPKQSSRRGRGTPRRGRTSPYRACADAVGRARPPAHDAAEARLEAILALARTPAASLLVARRGAGASIEEQCRRRRTRRACRRSLRSSAERSPRGVGDEVGGRRALNEALRLAQEVGRKEWAWRRGASTSGRGFSEAQGSHVSAHRDAEAALAILEETASKLPRDLREVFWDDPRASERCTKRTCMCLAFLRQRLPFPACFVYSGQDEPEPPASRGRSPRAPARAHPRSSRANENLPRLLSLVTDHAVALLGAERRQRASPRGRRLARRARASLDRASNEEHARFSRSVALRVLETGEPVVATSAGDDARLAEAVSVHQLHIQSIAWRSHSRRPAGGAPDRGALRGVASAARHALRGRAAHALRLRRSSRDRDRERAPPHREPSARRGARTRERRAREREESHLADPRAPNGAARRHEARPSAGARRDSRALRLRRTDRDERADAPGVRADRSGQGHRDPAADHRRERHGQGGRRARGARGGAPSEGPVRIGVNCGAIPAEPPRERVVRARTRRVHRAPSAIARGLIREASGGTLLLDEIGELPAKMQTGLLRVLQEKAVRAVGAANEERRSTYG